MFFFFAARNAVCSLILVSPDGAALIDKSEFMFMIKPLLENNHISTWFGSFTGRKRRLIKRTGGCVTVGGGRSLLEEIQRRRDGEY
jgi:hypothetical protein